jgi:hypothetical protein
MTALSADVLSKSDAAALARRLNWRWKLLLAAVAHAPRARPAADYYRRASSRVCQSAPVTSFRHFA